MKRTLSISLILIAIIVMALPAHASWLSALLFGRHTEYHMPGITYSIDEKLPAEWKDNAALDTRYWNGQTPIFQKTLLDIGVLIESGTASEREFRIYVTDPTKAIPLGAKLPKKRPESEIGGLRLLGEFRGKYGKVSLDTTDIEPGSIFLYAYVKQGRRYEKFGEQALSLRIAPPLEVVVTALKDAPDETLKEWGLESYPTVKEITRMTTKLIPDEDTAPVKFDVLFKDGGKMEGVQIAGRPQVGRVLGIFSMDALLVPARVTQINNNTIYVDVVSDCLRPYAGRENEILLAWVVKVYKYQLTGKKALDAEQQRNLMTYPDGPPGSETFGMRNMMVDMATLVPDGPLYNSEGKEILPDTIVHLRAPFAKNSSAMYQLAAQVMYGQHEHWVTAPYQPTENSPKMKMVESYVPEIVTETIRCVRLAAGGVPVVKVDEATSQVCFTPGLSTGAGILLGELFHKPNNTNNTNSQSQTSNNALSQSQTSVNTNITNTGEHGTATGEGTGKSGAESTINP